MQEHIAATPEIMKTGYFVLFSIDGYRIALSYSELCNRNDQAEFLLIDHGLGRSGGRYSVFPAADFFGPGNQGRSGDPLFKIERIVIIRGRFQQAVA